MPASNIPFTYAAIVNGDVYLYILVYSGATAPAFSASVLDKAKVIAITTAGAGSTKYFKRYQFSKGSLETIEISCGGHDRKFSIADNDDDSIPTESGEQAMEVPYTYTAKAIPPNDANHFKVEVVIFSGSDQNFQCSHSGPTAANNTTSVIDTNGATGYREFSDTHVFEVPNYVAIGGAHQVSSGGGRKSKTKNLYHSQTPFPPLLPPAPKPPTQSS